MAETITTTTTIATKVVVSETDLIVAMIIVTSIDEMIETVVAVMEICGKSDISFLKR